MQCKYLLIEWGQASSWEWSEPIANSWRTTGDIGDVFDGIYYSYTGWSYHCPCTDKNCWLVDYFDSGIYDCSITNILDKTVDITQYSKPGGFNDLDMLEVGNGGMTTTEYISHFSLWAALKSPLILGNNVANMTEEIAMILKNKEMIAINQDPLGLSAALVARFREGGVLGLNARIVGDIWVGDLDQGDMVAILFNRDNKPHDMKLSYKDHLKVKGDSILTLRDVWKHKTMENVQSFYIAENIPSHGVVVLRVRDAQKYKLHDSEGKSEL